MALGRPRQLALPVPATWGGRRPGAGRRPIGPRPGVPHRPRPRHQARHPAHVTLRAVPGLPSLRRTSVVPAVREAIRCGQREHFRICEFSVQGNHVHLLVEANGREALSRGMQGLAIRLARAINRTLGRRGKVWGDRHHSRALTTPREVRNALVYVLQNVKKHQPGFRGLDPCSSGPWFAGWREGGINPPADVARPVAAPRTWLLGAGWRYHGLVDRREAPRRSPDTP